MELKKQTLKAIRDGYAEGLLEVGKKHKNVVALSADLSSSARSNLFAKEFPARHFQVGICEQNMMSVAAGMAKLNKVPYIHSFAVFSPGRNWDQLRVSVCYQNLPVKIHGSHAGLTVGEDGATHQALEDIAITRVLPNLEVIVPCDANEAKQAVIASYQSKSPTYIRTSREQVPMITNSKNKFQIGKATKLSLGSDVTIIACGVEVHEALKAKDELKKQNIKVEVINCSTIKPLDKNTILSSVKKTNCVVTAEEHQIHGGLGSAISELLSSNYPVPMEFVAVKDVFGESGTPEELLQKYNLDSDSIVKAVHKVIKRKII